jgi:hypothetical protein
LRAKIIKIILSTTIYIEKIGTTPSINLKTITISGKYPQKLKINNI